MTIGTGRAGVDIRLRLLWRDLAAPGRRKEPGHFFKGQGQWVHSALAK